LAFAHRKLRVYGLAVELAAALFRATRSTPPSAWPVVRRLIRGVTSVALNIAEGAGEFTPREKARFYRMARRSASETMAALDLLVAMRLVGAQTADAAHSDLDEIAALLTGMVRGQEARSERKLVER
jgi:four helix bundle protein